ncbi:MAG: TRAM domain-containing protein [Actinobacteria bacterium]|nr:TRAM domain-containing protein [Actinomycetota bacterium]NIU64986.1 TRAM domain-containing protein [Actinomycetota bacterium]NIW26792.1 TRAM domain-containing protein [Actinomycetota bacterium]NIX19346.1 TRAM domain-containing protein [Actinomycetota bacterium]
MEIPEELLCLFSARIEAREGDHVIEVPDAEFDLGALDAGSTYRVALLPAAGSGGGSSEGGRAAARSGRGGRTEHREPPVEVGDVREVEIENLGDQGDGIARVDRGYVVIVPDTEVGDRVTVEIEDIHTNFAIASVVENHDA